jgi:hypothetical protein
MKIAILGSAPSSVLKAPFGDATWKIWACSPGAYPHLARVDAFWEVHRWEPGVVGKPQTQKPWFSPEYVQWLKTVPPRVWVSDPEALKDIGEPRAAMLPWQALTQRYGHYCWTSSIAYMLAMAIDTILLERLTRAAGVVEQDVIGLWGVDMAANEELYSGQRSACQFLLQVMVGLKIDFYIPPESDLAVPPPMYGVSEINHRAIKFLERERELQARMAQANAQAEHGRANSMFLQGALDDLAYHRSMWLHEGDALSFDFEKVFPELSVGREAVEAQRAVKPVAAASVMNSSSAEAQAVPAAPPSAEVVKLGVDPAPDVGRAGGA